MTETKTLIEIPGFVTVRELASLMGVSPINVIKELMNNGIMANINQQIDFDTAAIVAGEMGFDAVPVKEAEEEAEEAAEKPLWKQILAGEEEQNLVPRPPVITMLGHVDHGKTSLLDAIRHSNVTAGEAGGITQHIGAYQIEHNGQTITFLDTPGHEAFTAMRARGAQATDIAILVVAADDGVMPQTREAIDHARAAGVPIIVALNKMDLPSANPNKVKQQLAEVNLTPDEWDGDTLVIPVSAKQQQGIDDLLEAILLTAEEIEPRANPRALPSGTVLEARVEKGRGVMTTLLVQNGSLKVSDTLLIGDHYGRIRAMFDYKGRSVSTVGPSTPVSVSGLNSIPSAGEQFKVVDSEKTARRIVAEHELADRSQEDRRAPVTLDEFFTLLQEGETKTLNLIIKADVQGSLEPIVKSVNRLSTEEIGIEILRAATGNVTESDIMLAAASDAVVLGFNVDVDPVARVAAMNEQVEIKTYTIIYQLIEDVEKALKGMLGPVFQEAIIGRAEIRQVFKIRSVGNVAGAYMRTGEGRRNAKARVIRNGHVLYSGDVSSLKHLQENVREVKTGFEFGVNLHGWDDYQPGDIIEFFVMERVGQ
ncbi:MAG: translation initiation factor IF-2 [Chloroflexi bacterium]|nr:translation initiation factor IF-2 [Chloroflexota bacterium]MCI0575126.1 translation initiation factor IF-2 [Chloroflexota bacterium]MCI0646275.1 translation initiation factor IF-2 [Chloroflexota bacterium]MCI0728620.1 translation initiation factor IF-2 [Chloroflexota bacterium]